MRINPLLIGPFFIASLTIQASPSYAATQDETSKAVVVIETPAVLPPESSADIQAPAATDTDNVDDEDLTGLRGGESLVLGNQTLLAVSNGNSIGGSYTADNVNLSDNAFSNFSGVGNVVINTGAQASLQAGMNLIINLVP